LLIAFRKSQPVLHRSRFLTGLEKNDRGLLDITWHGCNLNSPGWDDPNSGVLALTYGGFADGADIHAMLNMEWQALDFEIPPLADRRWFRVVDTALPSPTDVSEPGQEQQISDQVYRVNGRSVVILSSKAGTKE